MNLKLVVVVVLVLLTSGCVKDEFGCAQFPETGCRPVSDVYEETNNGLVDYRKGLNRNESDGKTGVSSFGVVVSPSGKALNYSVSGDPILTKPRVIRVLFNSWEDKEKDLNAGGFIYIRLRDSQWVLTKNEG
jgi:Type IV conjugative transfer system lipoprotein (TraV)